MKLIKKDKNVKLYRGDCIDVMDRLIELKVQLDSIVTDPPYHLTSINKRFAKTGGADRKLPKKHHQYHRLSKGFMGQTWDGGDIAFRKSTWRRAYKLLKPGGYLLAFSSTRTYHRMAVAIEDAGFEIRDQLAWMYGSGFPKNHDTAKHIHKLRKGTPQGGADPDSKNHGKYNAKQGDGAGAGPGTWDKGAKKKLIADSIPKLHPDALPWEGWGTALKPAWEPIVMARKPLSEGSVARNVLKHGTGAINIAATRVGDEKRTYKGSGKSAIKYSDSRAGRADGRGKDLEFTATGRWPANIVHDGSEEVEASFAQYGNKNSGKPGVRRKAHETTSMAGKLGLTGSTETGYGDGGSISRYFYTAKASKKEKAGTEHPTVKPVSLMRWLVRMVTPKGGRTMDIFCGTGTTIAAALQEDCRVIGIEKDKKYIKDILRRIDRHYDKPEVKLTKLW